MTQLYASKTKKVKEMKPKKETISFLLNYSKSLTVFNVGKMKIETIAN